MFLWLRCRPLSCWWVRVSHGSEQIEFVEGSRLLWREVIFQQWCPVSVFMLVLGSQLQWFPNPETNHGVHVFLIYHICILYTYHYIQLYTGLDWPDWTSLRFVSPMHSMHFRSYRETWLEHASLDLCVCAGAHLFKCFPHPSSPLLFVSDWHWVGRNLTHNIMWN